MLALDCASDYNEGNYRKHYKAKLRFAYPSLVQISSSFKSIDCKIPDVTLSLLPTRAAGSTYGNLRQIISNGAHPKGAFPEGAPPKRHHQMGISARVQRHSMDMFERKYSHTSWWPRLNVMRPRTHLTKRLIGWKESMAYAFGPLSLFVCFVFTYACGLKDLRKSARITRASRKTLWTPISIPRGNSGDHACPGLC